MKLNYSVYSSNKKKTEYSFFVESERVLCILAQSGNGKTRLMNRLCGFSSSENVYVSIDGKILNDKNRPRISFIPDLDFFDTTEKTGNIVNYFSSMFIDFDRFGAFDLLERHKISSDIRACSLSFSDRQLLRLILGFCKLADFYVLDEPLRNFDCPTRKEILKKFLKKRGKAGIIIATSRPQNMEGIVNDICFMVNDNPVLFSDCKSLLQKTNTDICSLFAEVYGCR